MLPGHSEMLNRNLVYDHCHTTFTKAFPDVYKRSSRVKILSESILPSSLQFDLQGQTSISVMSQNGNTSPTQQQDDISI